MCLSLLIDFSCQNEKGLVTGEDSRETVAYVHNEI